MWSKQVVASIRLVVDELLDFFSPADTEYSIVSVIVNSTIVNLPLIVKLVAIPSVFISV